MSVVLVSADALRVPGLRIAEVLAAILHIVNGAKRGSRREARLNAHFGTTADERKRSAWRLWWQMRRGRRPRPGYVVTSEREGREPRQILVLAPDDAVVARVIERRLRRILEPLLPREFAAVRSGSSVQALNARIAKAVKDGPHATILRLDHADCFESINPDPALTQLETMAVPDYVLAYLREFYRVNAGLVYGLGRGPAFCPIIALVYLLPVYRLLRSHASWVAWTGDDFAAATDEAGARYLHDAVAAETAKLGLRLSTKPGKRYLGPATGAWSFGGLEYENLRAHPKGGATEHLISKIKKAEETGGDIEAMNSIQAGWAGHYVLAVTSPEIIKLSNQLQAEFGPGIRRLTDLMLLTLARMYDRLYVPRTEKKKEDPNHPRDGSRLPLSSSSSSSARGSPFPRAACMSQGAGPQTPVPWDQQDSLDLLYHPERTRPLHPSELRVVTGMTSADYVTWAEHLDLVLRSCAYEALGYSDESTFIRMHLRSDPSDVKRLINVGLLAADVEREDISVDAPIGLLRALQRVRSNRVWANAMTALLLKLVSLRLVSSRQAKKALRAALSRAHLVNRVNGLRSASLAGLVTRTKGRRLQSRWSVRTLTKGDVIVEGSNVETRTQPSARPCKP
jgi:hypothetical protein